jgi:hypothetical protein
MYVQGIHSGKAAQAVPDGIDGREVQRTHACPLDAKTRHTSSARPKGRGRGLQRGCQRSAELRARLSRRREFG